MERSVFYDDKKGKNMRIKRILLFVLGTLIFGAIGAMMTANSLYELVGLAMVAVILIAIISALIIIPISRDTKCPACNKKFALKKVGDVETGRENISVKMKLENKDRNGEVIGTSEQYVPGKRIFYKRTYICKYCGEKSYSTYSRDKASV